MNGGLVGRQAELDAAIRFLDSLPEGPAGLLISGEPGIGKSALWERVVLMARARGMCVLAARPAQAEARLSFAGLADLLEPVVDEMLPALSGPQRTALAVALLRQEPQGRCVDQRAVSAAMLSVLRRLVLTGPVLVAVDDLQWLDRSSAAVVDFAVRRLGVLPIGVVACHRPEPRPASPVAVDRALPAERIVRLELGPLSLAALHEILKAELGMQLPRRVVVRIERVAAGNPFFALELARTLGDRPMTGNNVPLTENLRDLVATRVAGLPRSVQTVLLAVAALRAPTVAAVAAATAGSAAATLGALEQAQAAGIVTLDQPAVRFVHPLFSAGVYESAPRASRRRVHRRLAAFVDEPEERARHLALAAPGPDAALAAALDEAADSARARGAPETAAELVEAARRLTPAHLFGDARRRAVRAAEYHFHAGELDRARQLLDDVLGQEPTGLLRADALRLLAEIHYHRWSMPEAIRMFEAALEHADTDLRLRSLVERHLAFVTHATGDFVGAAAHALSALTLAEQLGDEPGMAEALAVSLITDYLLGRGLDEVRLERALAMEDQHAQAIVDMRPTHIAGHLMLYEGRLNRARELFGELRQRVLDRGEDSDLPYVSVTLAWAECLGGDLAAATAHVDEAMESAERVGTAVGLCWALAFGAAQSAYAGDVQATHDRAEQSLDLAATTGMMTVTIWSRWALAVLALSRGDAAAADAALKPLTVLVEMTGIEEPIRCMFLSDHIEALIGLGQLDRAQRLTDMLEQAGRHHQRGWVLHQACRCRALLLAARGDVESAALAAADALLIGQRLEHRMDYARTLLAGAQIERRHRRRAEAQQRAEHALAIFEQAGARLWAQRARDELARATARPAGTGLTETERRVAELAAAGHTNRQVAAALFISPKTVEANLARVYAKLGIRSRAELGSRIGLAPSTTHRQTDKSSDL
jgi:DNA-binding CsgD family transcriptional regulator